MRDVIMLAVVCVTLAFIATQVRGCEEASDRQRQTALDRYRLEARERRP